jgi:signal transduction histidine kinase
LQSTDTSSRGVRRLTSTASRVALVAVVSAALSGLVAALIAIAAVDHLIAVQADQRLMAATVTLAGELDEDPADEQQETLEETVADENGEIRTSGIRLAVFAADRRVAGDAASFLPPAGSCETRLVGSDRVRACASSHRSWALVAAQKVDERRLYVLYAFAALGAIVLGGLVGAVASAGLVRFAVGPLVTLAQTLRASRPDALGSLDLSQPSDNAEVEAIRSALQVLALRLELLLEQSNRFAADAAHELRTPLTTLRTELELLAETSSVEERTAIERASARVAALAELVERLLVLAQPSERLREGFEAVALADLAEEVANALTAKDRERVVLDLAGEGLIRGDARLLRSLLSNALGNALKFAPTSPVTLRISESAADSTAEPGSVLVEVSDLGPGIPEALRGRVFEPFYRANPRTAEGHGLGLALIGHIANAHGGSARFEPADRGARLHVRLPAWQATARAPASSGDPTPA